MLSLIADPTRARVLCALDAMEELCVGDLSIALEVNEDAVGYAPAAAHRWAGHQPQAGRVYYRLADRFPEPLREHCLRQLVRLSRTPPADDD